MKINKSIRLCAAVAAFSLTAALSAIAQQITGVPGSPGATVTIDGKQIPPPPMPFGGEIKESALDSKPYWPPRVVPPKGAPNVLLIMTDDSGYGVPSTFGGVIPTPALDRIAKAADLTQFMGEPQRIVKSTDGSELWEYHKANDMVVPKGESTSFFGGGNNYGLSGAFSSEKRPEDRTSSVEHIARFKIF